ncbi:MAG: DEAD/DEAH box helicase [Deltaproteobacteria bacterium]|nr:DEAD/DEAH box helicase [Deltaproteobacteria bacterium]
MTFGLMENQKPSIKNAIYAPIALTAQSTVPFVAHLHLFTETLLIDNQLEENVVLTTGAAILRFDYGGTLIRMSDSRTRFFRNSDAGIQSIERDIAAEQEVQRLIESFGAIETACLNESSSYSGNADYIINTEADMHALCTFTSYAIPQLRAYGIKVDIDPNYHWQTVDAQRAWYASIDKETPGWLNLELGIDVDGQKQNLLPILLTLIDKAPADLELNALAHSARRLVGLKIGINRYLTIAPKRLLKILRVLIELNQGHKTNDSRLLVNNLQIAGLKNLERIFSEENDSITINANAFIKRQANAFKSLGQQPAWTPAGLQTTLRPYQRAGLAWLTALAEQQVGGILADDMGLGKTLQVISHLLVLRDAKQLITPALVVTPTSLVKNWQRELQRFAPTLRTIISHGPQRNDLWQRAKHCEVVLTTYPIVLRDQNILSELNFSLLVLDEAQIIKNSRSQIHQAVKTLPATRRLCLSGTPIENNLQELWSLFDFAVPGLLGSQNVFRDHFALPIEQGGCNERLIALRNRVAPFILRRHKRDVAPELPPKTEIVRPVELTDDQRDLYETIRLAAHDQIRKAVNERGMAGATITILDALMKLRQVCCDPRLLRLDAARTVSTSAKYDLFFDIVTAQLEQNHRVLVFSQFTTMLALLAKGLSERGIRHAILTGATNDRQAQVDIFQHRRAEVFLISLKAGGTGLNLTEADTVIHYDPWWNPAAQAQATDRAYRIGQLRPVFVYNLIAAGSVEERILALQRQKQELANNILHNTDPSKRIFSADEVQTLLAPLDTEPAYKNETLISHWAKRHNNIRLKTRPQLTRMRIKYDEN